MEHLKRLEESINLIQRNSIKLKDIPMLLEEFSSARKEIETIENRLAAIQNSISKEYEYLKENSFNYTNIEKSLQSSLENKLNDNNTSFLNKIENSRIKLDTDIKKHFNEKEEILKIAIKNNKNEIFELSKKIKEHFHVTYNEIDNLNNRIISTKNDLKTEIGDNKTKIDSMGNKILAISEQQELFKSEVNTRLSEISKSLESLEIIKNENKLIKLLSIAGVSLNALIIIILFILL